MKVLSMDCNAAEVASVNGSHAENCEDSFYRSPAKIPVATCVEIKPPVADRAEIAPGQQGEFRRAMPGADLTDVGFLAPVTCRVRPVWGVAGSSGTIHFIGEVETDLTEAGDDAGKVDPVFAPRKLLTDNADND